MFWKKYWQYDPGLFRLKHAAKTVLAVLLAVAVFSKFGMITRVTAGIAAGFSIQGVVGETTKNKLISLVIADICFLGAYLIGASVRPYPLLSGIFLTLLAFFVMYVRRFGPRFSTFPLLVWAVGFLATVLSSPNDTNLILHGIAMIIGFLISGGILLAVFPENKRYLFYDNIAIFLSHYADVFSWLKQQTQFIQKPQAFSAQTHVKKSELLHLMQLNETIASITVTLSPGRQNRLNKLVVWQFSLTKALAIIFEGFETLHRESKILPKNASAQLNALMTWLTRYINSIAINKNTDTIEFKPIHNGEALLRQFREDLKACMTVASENNIALLNIYLGFRMIFRNLL